MVPKCPPGHPDGTCRVYGSVYVHKMIRCLWALQVQGWEQARQAPASAEDGERDHGR